MPRRVEAALKRVISIRDANIRNMVPERHLFVWRAAARLTTLAADGLPPRYCLCARDRDCVGDASRLRVRCCVFRDHFESSAFPKPGPLFNSRSARVERGAAKHTGTHERRTHTRGRRLTSRFCVRAARLFLPAHRNELHEVIARVLRREEFRSSFATFPLFANQNRNRVTQPLTAHDGTKLQRNRYR